MYVTAVAPAGSSICVVPEQSGLGWALGCSIWMYVLSLSSLLQMLPCQEYGLVAVFPPLSLLTLLGCFAGAGYGSHNAGSVAETVKSYIPGAEANRESRAEQGHDTGHDSYTGSGSQGYGSANQGYNNSNTGSSTAGGGLLSYIPGTEANREAHAEQGQDSSTYRSGTTGGNTGGVMSYIPGTEANRESRAEHGQSPSTFSSSNNTGSNTGGGLTSYIPGTEANRESRAEHAQAAQQGNPAQTLTGSGLSQHNPAQAAPQVSSEYGSSAAALNAPAGTGHRVYGKAAETQGTGVLGKLKAAVGVSSGADTAPGAHSSWSTSQNPAFDSDTPRSSVGAPTAFTEAQPTGHRRSLSNAPPSASWGSSAQTASYAPTQALSGGPLASQAMLLEVLVWL